MMTHSRGRHSRSEIVKRRLNYLARPATGRLRALPDFLVLGAQKCGTSSFYSYLISHPDVLRAAGKEVHFFDLHFERGTNWYQSKFPLRQYRDLLERSRGRSVLTGEATPAYLFYPLAPKRAAEIVPEAKLIVILRDPAERAVSHYSMVRKAGLEPLDLSEAIRNEPRRLAVSFDELARGVDPPGRDFHNYSYISRGLYAEQLDRWLRYFPRDRILVLQSADLEQNPTATLRTTFEFLGIDCHVSWNTEYPRLNQGKHADIDPATLSELRAMFREPNERLRSEFGVDFVDR